MKCITSILIAGLIVVVPFAGVVVADRESKTPQRILKTQGEKPAPAVMSDGQQRQPVLARGALPPVKPANAVDMPVYTPPLRGAPGGRVTGGSRGAEDVLPTLAALVPDHTGLSVQAQPTLYWYLSKTLPYPVEFTLIDDQAIQPLVEVRLPALVRPGLQWVRLADHGIRLQPGVLYQWFVALVVDPDQRSKDFIAGGTIERITPPEALRAKLVQAGQARVPYVYAETGLWYDAMMAVSELINAAPHDIALRQQRAALLQQVGLADIAKDDMRRSQHGSP